MRTLLTAACLLFTITICAQSISAYDLSCEHKSDPMGIDAAQPRLSWKMKVAAEAQNIKQTAYSIRVATRPDFSRKSITWTSGKVAGDASVLVPYAGPQLKSGERYYWQVKIWDNNLHESPWSQPAFWEMGLLNPGDWKASWIEPRQDTLPDKPAPQVRKVFAIEKKVIRARAYVSAHGFYQLFLNGEKVGDQVLTPGWTEYNDRLQYQVYDVTDMLKRGENAIGAMLGDGWYRGRLGWVANFAIWGKKLGLICQVNITYSDGSTDQVYTNNSWKGTLDGPVLMNSIYDGETYDARKELNGWAKAGYDDSRWQPVNEAGYDKSILIGTQTVPVRRIQEIKPVNIFRTPKGTLVADLGQNMVGWIRLKVNGPAGTVVTIRHAEVLDKYGEFYTENLRQAKASITYTLKGGGDEVYEPHFTFMGFRYVAVDGFPGELTADNITGIVVHSDMTPTGTFSCSDPLINQLQHNIQWGQKGNFLDVPTDCPQRDERLGWTGDAQAFCRTAAFNMDVSAFFTKWLKDVAADQGPEGQIPFVIPDVLRNNATSAGWGDVATIAPWTMYQVYGDRRLLETQYPSMKAYVEYIRKKAGDNFLWNGGSVFGDWLFYKSMRQTENDGYTSPDMIATMFFAYSASLVSQAAAVLGNTSDQQTYNNLYEQVKAAFLKNYVTPAGRIASESQTAYVLALMFDLLPSDLQVKATDYLVADIKGRGNHLSTGFLGTPYLCHVLTQHGRTDVAYDLLLQQTYPSWLYPVKMGATTIWERWDGEKTDSTFQDAGMNSFNHYAYGAIGDWMYRVVAGIEIGAPGYKQIILQPHPDKRLEFAKASYDSDYGTIASGWERRDGKLKITVTVPANTSATAILPGTSVDKTTVNGQSLSSAIPASANSKANVKVPLGSGTYVFEYDEAVGR